MNGGSYGREVNVSELHFWWSFRGYPTLPYFFTYAHMPICPKFRKENALYFTWGRKKISNVFSSQLSGRAQLPGVFIYWVDHFSKYFISGGHTCTILSHPNKHQNVYFLIFKMKQVFRLCDWIHQGVPQLATLKIRSTK